MITTIHWAGYKAFTDESSQHECNICRNQEHCGYVGSEGLLMEEDNQDAYGWPIVLACNGFMSIEKPPQTGPICTLSPRQRMEVRAELHKARREREAKESEHD